MDKTSIKDAGFSVKTYNALSRSGNQYLEDLAGKNIKELIKIRNLGRTGAEEVIRVCAEHGIETGIGIENLK